MDHVGPKALGNKITKMDNFVVILSCKWYITTYKKLSIGKLFQKIASLRDIDIRAIRKFEKLCGKLAAIKQDLKFLNRCEELDLIPDYLQFNPPAIEAYQDAKPIYRKALIEQRVITRNNLKNNIKEWSEQYNFLKERISLCQLKLIIFAVNHHSLDKIKRDKDSRHKKKLYKLWNRQKTSVPSCVINLSDKDLTICEQNALMFGPRHHLLPRKIDEMTMKAQIESQINRICKNNHVQLSYNNKTKLREATDNFLHESRNVCNTKKNKAIHNTLKSISLNSKIKCLKMDKGVGIVVLNTEDYYSKLDKIVEDKSKFRKIDYSLKDATTLEYCQSAPWVAKEKSMYNYTWKYIKLLVDYKDYYKLLPNGSKPGRLYGMAKNHKEGCPLRPVLSAIDTPEYNLSKWIETQIKPFYNSKWSVSSTNSFVEDLNTIKPCSNDICVSFDIKSLYTNVPLEEVVDDVTRVLYDEADAENTIFKICKDRKDQKGKKEKIDEKGRKLTKRVFKNMLMACSKSIFLYNNQVYEQIDGLSMGSPLAPILANWFVSKIENAILEDPSIKQPKFYRRYVDDIFAVFHSEEDRDIFFKHLNMAHKNLSFTMENVNTSSQSLPFLDVEIRIANNEFETKVYRKPTNTGVLLNYEAMAPKKWKRSLIRCFLSRAQRNSSSREFLKEEISNIRKIFRANAYPMHFIDEVIEDFFQNVDTNNNCEKKPSEVVPVDDAPKKVYFVLPYIGKASERLQRKVRKEMEEHHIDIKPAFRTTKVEQYMSLKSAIPALFKTDVVYEFRCPCDKDIHYIGETNRQFFERILDHVSRSTGATPTAVNNHIVNCTSCSNTNRIIECFSILRDCSSADVFSEEALCIRQYQPSLNVQMGPYRGARCPTRIFN